MKYQEIKKRLDKCQLSLELLQTKQASVTSTRNTDSTKRTKAAIKVLKESIKKYKKILNEGEESYLLTPKGGKPTLAKLSPDEVNALKDSDDVDKIKTASGDEVKESNLLTKNSGVEFTVEETKDIAKLVGKALAKTLKKAGDELSKMKAHRIDVNSFDIYVEYKKDVNIDDFSFYIANDKLHIVDFSFNKELVEVGVKPSGEGIINVDVLSNELLKHFKSLSESGDYDPDQEQRDDEEDHGVGYDDEGRPLGEGEGDDHHYIKVKAHDYKKAMAILDQNVDPTYVKMEVVDNDGAGNVIIYFIFKHEDGFDDMYDDSENPDSEFYQEPDEDPQAFVYDVVMDLRANDIELADHSAEMDEATNFNDPVLMKMRVAKKRNADFKKLDAYNKSPEGKAAVRAQASAERKEQKAREVVRKLKIKRAQVEREMENDPGTEPQGGPVSDMYGDQLNKIDSAIEKAASVYNKPMDYDTAVGRVSEDISMKIGKVVAIKKYNAARNQKVPVDVKITDYIKKPGSKDFVEYELKGKKRKVSIDVFKSSLAENMVADKDIAKEIKKLEAENPKGFAKEISRLKARQAAIDLMKKTKKKTLKEFTDNRFKGSELIDDANKRGPDMFGKGIFAELLPKGVASENDAVEALKAHDKSPIKARMGRYAPMFVHVQYHNLEHEGEEYQMHQTQYYNSNFKDRDPSFNPGVSKITLFKDPEGEDTNLGTIIVKTDQYVQDLRNLPGLGKRVSEATRKDLGIGSSVSKRRAKAELKQKLKGVRSDGLGKYDATVYGLDSDGKRVELKSLNDLNKFDKFELDADIKEGRNKLINEFVGKELEDRNEPLYDKLVPGSGKADTVQGEMLRAINRIVYRYYNDGDEYHTGYGTETAGPAHSFLVNANHPLRSLVSTLFKKGTNYEQTIKDVLDAILDHIESRQGKYTPNSEDMYDYESEFEDDTYEEEEYDDYDYDDDYDEFDNEEQYQNEDLDVGHKDDEPKMIQKELYDIAQYASKLFKRLKKYDSMEDEVDFPHWWQKKVTLAREYISSAQHYLEGEEEARLSGKLTLENLVSEYGGSASRNLDEIFGALGYRQGFDEFIEDNPGCVEAIMEWIGSIPDFRKRLTSEYDSESLENLGFYYFDEDDYNDDDFNESVTNEANIGLADLEEIGYTDGDKAVAMHFNQDVIGINNEIDYKYYRRGFLQGVKDSTASYKLEENEDKGGQIQVGDYVKNQHGNIYQRVDGKVGRHDAYVRVTNGKAGKRKTGLHDSFKLTLVNKSDLDEVIKEEATCCGKCGRVHVKGNCKRPYLKGKSHCRTK